MNTKNETTDVASIESMDAAALDALAKRIAERSAALVAAQAAERQAAAETARAALWSTAETAVASGIRTRMIDGALLVGETEAPSTKTSGRRANGRRLNPRTDVGGERSNGITPAERVARRAARAYVGAECFRHDAWLVAYRASGRAIEAAIATAVGYIG